MLLQVRQLERTVSLRDLSIMEIDEKMRELSAATYDGVFVWKISDFTKKRQDAVAGRAPAMFSPGNTFYYEKYHFCYWDLSGFHISLPVCCVFQHFIQVNMAIRCACGST